MAYPLTIDTMGTDITPTQTLAQAGHADRHLEIANAINAIQIELGINPSGTPTVNSGATTVTARLDNIDTTLNTKATSASPTFTGVQANSSGTAALPSITFTGDLDTGIYRPAANQVSIATNGSAALTVSTGGQVDIAGNLIAIGTIAGSGLAGSLLSSATPQDLGTAMAGTSTVPARQDHTHSSSITNATLTTPTINGAVTTVLTNQQNGTTYTLAASDRDKVVELNNSSAISVTVPTHAAVPMPTGSTITLLQTGTGQVTIGGAGVTINGTPGLKIRAQWSSVMLLKRSDNLWVALGDLAA